MRQYQAMFMQGLSALLGWIFVWPITFIVPRVRQRFVVLGRDRGKFLDNSKHFFISLQRPKFNDVESIYLTDLPQVRNAILDASCRVIPMTGLRTWWALLRCGTAVVDSMDWSQGGRFAALRGARVVQLWHGIPLKRIELLVEKQIAAGLSSPLRLGFRIYRAFIGRHRKVDCLVSTSEFVAREAMKQCFHADTWPTTGYPRNDVLLDSSLQCHPLMSIGVDDEARLAVQGAKNAKRHVVLYAPTFRKHFIDPFSYGVLDLHALDRFIDSINALLLVKLHPWMQQPKDSGQIYHNIAFASPDSDIYPLLADVDILVTDYSSIYFDYLLLDKPIVFFCHDLDDYLSEDRGFIFDYATMTPGPKVRSQTELQAEVRAALAKDTWHEERIRVRNLVFDHVDGKATTRLMSYLGPM